jgi:hypothetical protein
MRYATGNNAAAGTFSPSVLQDNRLNLLRIGEMIAVFSAAFFVPQNTNL